MKLLLYLSLTACSLTYQRNVLPVPKNSRVGVLVNGAGGALAQTYVYEALSNAGFWPVSLQDLHLPFPNTQYDVKDAANIAQTPTILAAAQKFLIEKNIAYVMAFSTSASALDRDLRAEVIRVEDLTVMSSRFYQRRIMAGLWVGLSFVMGASLLVVPWFYFIKSDGVEREMIAEFIQSMGQTVVKIED